MKTILFLTLGLIIVSCNEPTRNRRLAYQSDNSNNNAYQYGANFSTTNPTVAPTSISPTPTTNPNIPSDANHCKWSTDGITGFERQSTHLGEYTLCQSKTDETKVYIQLKTVPEKQICIIPTSADSSGGSVYIGEPRCLLVTSNLAIYPVTLLKNRQSFTSYPLNSVIMMKDLIYYTYGYPYSGPRYAPTAYLECMANNIYLDTRYCKAFNALGQHVFHKF